MTRLIKLIANKGTDVDDKVWKAFVKEFKRKFSMYTINGGISCEYVEADKIHVGGFPDVSYYANEFKEFAKSNIYLELYDLEQEPEGTFTL